MIEERVEDIVGCARCDGEGHPGLVFKKFTNPVRCPVVGHALTYGGAPTLDWWALCPTTGEPILLQVVKS